uniref:Uncharacterized protein n=1 Tax=Anguilla anguilla TaxID=7936 RepID=A0A0E9X1S5_ANGAN
MCSALWACTQAMSLRASCKPAHVRELRIQRRHLGALTVLLIRCLTVAKIFTQVICSWLMELMLS